MNKIVVDTNVLVSAFTTGDGASREVLRRILTGHVRPVISTPLFAEYEDVLSRPETQARCPLSDAEQSALFDAFISKTRMVEVYFSWRPNLRDEGDNLVVELAVAASPCNIVTHNLRDFANAELKFPSVKVLTPAQWLKLQGA